MVRISTRFGAHTSAAEVVAGIDLAGRRAIVTGAGSGIGVETARALALAGAEVTLLVRDAGAGAAVAADIAGSTGNHRLRVAALDLADRPAIAAFAAGWRGPLHLLMNNAGVMALPERRTAEGFELQFATNHLGHFALACALRRALASAGRARIVSVSSSAHLASPVVFDDLHFAFRPYDPLLAYAQSKTANVLFAVGASARWAADGITANALMPGAIATNLQRHIDPGLLQQWRDAREKDGAQRPLPRKTPEQGAATSVLLATSPLLEGIGGRYFEDCNEAEVVDSGKGYYGVAPYALDPGNAERLWEVSRRMLG